LHLQFALQLPASRRVDYKKYQNRYPNQVF
jgi:hypothetical protein